MKNLNFTFLPRSCERNSTLLAIRPHWLEMVPSLFLTTLGASSLIGVIITVFVTMLPHVPMALMASGAVFFTALVINGITIAHWYFHGYVLSNGRIMEYYSLPLLLHVTNGILLNQVRCTEIDISKNGLWQHLFDIGDITITFDRPTRQEVFVLHHVASPEEVGQSLSEILDISTPLKDVTPLWTRPVTGKGQLIFTEAMVPSLKN